MKNFKKFKTFIISAIIFGILILWVLSLGTAALGVGDILMTVEPEKPNPGDDVTLTIMNKTGEKLKRVKITVYDPNWETVIDVPLGTDGKIRFNVKETGLYKVNVANYPETLNFSVKKNLLYSGPNPQKPVVGEQITMSVPPSVGVKVLDSLGILYLAGKTKLNRVGQGQVNFTIDKAGKYTIVIGEFDRDFWSENVTLEVSEKGILDLKITPEEPILGKPITLEITSNNMPIENVEVKINTPKGVSEKKVTTSTGKINYVPEFLGEYTVEIKKEKYLSLSKNFFSYNSFVLEIMPKEIGTNELIAVKIKNQIGEFVSNAKVSISGTNINLFSDSLGEVKFSLPEPREYEISVEKDDFWKLSKTFQVFEPLNLELPERNEVLESFSIDVLDSKRNKISADEIKVITPKNEIEIIGESYKPQEVGKYEILARKSGYKTANKSLEIVPKPLEIEEKILGRKLSIAIKTHSQPVSGIDVLVETPYEQKFLVTDDDGVVEFDVTSEGNMTIFTNFGKKNKIYDEVVTKGYAKKKYSFMPLFLAVFLILIIAIYFILNPPKKLKEIREKREKGKSYFKKEKGKSSLEKTGEFQTLLKKT